MRKEWSLIYTNLNPLTKPCLKQGLTKRDPVVLGEEIFKSCHSNSTISLLSPLAPREHDHFSPLLPEYAFAKFNSN